ITPSHTRPPFSCPTLFRSAQDARRLAGRGIGIERVHRGASSVHVHRVDVLLIRLLGLLERRTELLLEQPRAVLLTLDLPFESALDRKSTRLNSRHGRISCV